LAKTGGAVEDSERGWFGQGIRTECCRGDLLGKVSVNTEMMVNDYKTALREIKL